MRPVVHQARGPAAERLRAVLLVAKLGDLRPVAEQGVDATVRGGRKPGRPARVQSVERPDDRCRRALTVAQLGFRVGDRGPAVENVGRRKVVLGSVAIGIPEAAGTEENASAEKIGVQQRRTGLVDASRAARAHSGLQRPGIARLDFDIDQAVVVADRHDADIVKNPVRAHQALRLFDEAHRDALAGLEQQLAPHDRGARLDVQGVGGSVEDAVFLLVGEVEDVAGVDPHLADERSGRLELGEGRDFPCGGPLSRSRRERAGDHRAAAAEQTGEDGRPDARYSGLIPASLTTFAHLTVSEAMKRPNSSGLICAASPPSVSKRFFVSAEARITESSRCSRSMTGRGVPAGATMPHQLVASYPGTPASEIVGTSGRAGTRAALPTPSGFKRPERMWGSVWMSEPMAIWVLPAITSIIAGPPPLNGMCTMSRPDCSLNSELARCWKLPTPAEA